MAKTRRIKPGDFAWCRNDVLRSVFPNATYWFLEAKLELIKLEPTPEVSDEPIDDMHVGDIGITTNEWAGSSVDWIPRNLGKGVPVVITDDSRGAYMVKPLLRPGRYAVARMWVKRIEPAE